MFSQHNEVTQSTKTWILVANRTHAKLLESHGGLKSLKGVEQIEFPEGRLKNREIDTDRASGGASTAGMNYAMHGMVNKGEAHFHMTQIFARQLCGLLDKARAENRFQRLVLIAETRFLGELRASLTPATSECVVQSLDKDLAGLEMEPLKERLGELLTLRAAS